MVRLAAAAGALLTLVLSGAAQRAHADTSPAAADGACIDDQLKADLDAKRRHRSVKDRLVQKTNRHELGIRGGQYVSDVFDATYIAGAAYAYHLTEDFAVEASGAYTRISSTGGPELERTFSVLGGQSRRSLLFASNLMYSPLHGKLQAGASVQHFDLYVTVGAGVVDSVLSSGIAGNGGFGLAFFLGPAFAVRLDVRDYVYRQQLLTRKLVVNDLAATLGFSVFLPFAE